MLELAAVYVEFDHRLFLFCDVSIPALLSFCDTVDAPWFAGAVNL
jgi:hypothetical protein